MQLVDLRVESLTTPLGVEILNPRLSWRMESNAAGARQTAYRLTAASSRERLVAPDLWDTGVQDGSRSLDVPYGGAPLQSRAIVWWRVECWDEQGRRAEAVSWWEMGLLAVADWSAHWLAIEAEEDRADREAGMSWVWGDQPRSDSTRKFRFAFTVEKPVEARIFVGGRDRLDGLWIGGKSFPVLRPADIDFVAPPLTEITTKLDAGRHVLAVEVSFNPNLGIPSVAGAFCALVRLWDGMRMVRLATPETWLTSISQVPGWTEPDFDDSDWPTVQTLPHRPIPWPARPAMWARREFAVGQGIKQARLYATALGAFEASINGERVGDALLAPGYVDFRGRTPYCVYDVTSMLRTGDNALGFLVGDGWFASACAPGSRFPFVDAPRRLFAQLEVVYENGCREVVATDDSWRIKESAIRASEIYNGETYDARLEELGWDRPGHDSEGWTIPLLAEPAPGKLCSDIVPPVRVREVLTPRSISQMDEGIYLFDFGQNFAGVLRLDVRALAGAIYTMRVAESLKDGQLDPSNLRAAQATDTYICRGDSFGETYQPHFTFHGFRYVEVSVSAGAPPPALTAGVIHSDLPIIAEFETSDPILAGIWRNALWSQRSNFVAIPTDCPQRDERLGWTGDAMVFWDAATLNMDVTAFTRRFLDEVRFGQLDDGAFPVFAPSSWRQPVEMGPTPGWADAGVVLPWTTWKRSGDTSIIDANWDAMCRYLAGIQANNPEMCWLRKRGADFGDWLSVDSKSLSDVTTPKDLIGTALWAADCAMMGDMAEAIGRAGEADAFRGMHAAISRAFQAAYVADDGTVGNGSQTSYILPLYFGLLTRDQRESAARRFADGVRARGSMLTTGFIGTPFALHVLADTGNEALAVDLLRRTDFPSWGYMLSKGATTMWERWNSDTGGVQMNSFNHYAFGAVGSFLMRRIVGIDSAEPGFRRIRVRPVFDARLGSISGSLQSPMGRIAVRWSRGNGKLALSLSVPANTTAEVHLRGSGIEESGVALLGRTDMRVLQQSGEETIIEVGAGRFEFASALD